MACAALAESAATETAEQPAAAAEEVTAEETTAEEAAAEVTAQTAGQQLTLEEAISLAEKAYPDYTFALKKKVSRGGVKYYRLKGTSEKDTKRVYVSMDDGTLLTKKQYKKLKKDKKDKDDD